MSELKDQIRELTKARGYVWPGGYPAFAITQDCAALCFKCIRSNYRLVLEGFKERSSWTVVAYEINWENNTLTCENCNKDIASAYE